MWLCRWQRDGRDALTWRRGRRSACRQVVTRAAQGPDPGLSSPSPQVRPHVTDFADPLGGPRGAERTRADEGGRHRPPAPTAAPTADVRGFIGNPELAYIAAVA